MPRLTKRLVETTLPRDKDLILWDSEMTGFCCKITPKGRRIYMLYYRSSDRRQRKPKIGEHGVMGCEEARSVAQRWLLQIAQGGDPSVEKQEVRLSPTLKELADRYTAEYAPRKKASIQKEDQRLWVQHILPALGHVKVSSLTRTDIAKLHHAFHHHPTMANRIVSLLSKALNLAELWGYRPNHSNPCLHIKKYTEVKRERFLNQDEILRLMEALKDEAQSCQNPWTIHAIRLLLLTGCRLSEILTLRWEDVDLDTPCLNLPDSKTGRKVVYLSSMARQLFEAIPRFQDNPYVICGDKQGSHLINLQKPWRRIRKKAGLDDVRLHDLRHTFASIAASQGLSLPIIGALLGHKNTQTTQRYAHLMGGPLLEATEKIAQKIFEEGGQ
ncbi:DUF4102 domain-containing protein [bacterium NHP-B]|nr:DUF4102 domain-containing protein [bacterium NHP-B]